MALIIHSLKVHAMYVTSSEFKSGQPLADANACLVGMVVRNTTFGEGVITATYRDGTEYCDIVFAPDTAPRRYRIDLLTGWGKFFDDNSKEIAKRHESYQHCKVEATRDAPTQNTEHSGRRAMCAGDGSLQAFITAKQESDATAMSALIHARRIPHLLHFTRIENLERILIDGIVPRAALATGDFIANDLVREDGYTEASCLSIGFPNYKMFYKYQCKAPTDCVGWAVIAINPQALLNQPCLFYPTNAAAHESRRQSQADVTALAGTAGLQAMFAEPYAGLRSSLGLPEHYTTDPQAEVLAFGNIGPEYFTSVELYAASRRADVETRIHERLPSLRILKSSSWFNCRNDHEFWKGRRIWQPLASSQL
jgi:hypothetical protein